jgi:hypothetical protein
MATNIICPRLLFEGGRHGVGDSVREAGLGPGVGFAEGDGELDPPPQASITRAPALPAEERPEPTARDCLHFSNIAKARLAFTRHEGNPVSKNHAR